MVSILHLKAYGRSRTFSEPRRAKTRSETTNVFVYTIYRFEIIIHIRFYSMKTQKIIYIDPTLVLTRVCQTWMMHHVNTPITLPELSSPLQPRWSESIISPYTTCNTRTFDQG